MIPLHVTAWSSCLALVVGTGLDQVLALRLAASSRIAGVARAMLLAALLLHAWAVHPLFALALLGLLVIAVRGVRLVDDGDQMLPRFAADGERRLRDQWSLGAVLMVGACVVCRPSVPLYWDEFVWLAKARLASISPSTLHVLSLQGDERVFPKGYPLLWSELAGWLGTPFFGLRGLGGAPASVAEVVSGAAMATLLAVAAFVPSAVSVRWARRMGATGSAPAVAKRVAAGALMATCAAIATPLVFVHLRSAYADLPLGLLAAALFSALWEGEVGAAAVLAATVGVVKDEGAVLVAIAALVILVHAVRTRPWGDDPRARARLLSRRAYAAVVALVAVGLLVGVHRGTLLVHGVHNSHHSFGEVQFSQLPWMTWLLVEHALSIRTHGIIWVIVIACVIAARRAPARSSRRPLATAVTLQVGAYLLALVLGPEAVRSFATSGTVFNRMLLQILPTAWLLIHAIWSGESS